MKPERTPLSRKYKAPMPPQAIEHPALKDPVEVFCRIRPLDVSSQVCALVLDKNTIELTAPETSFAFRNGKGKKQEYRFQQVFPNTSSQKEIFNKVAKPLVGDLLAGRNGLLFAYGITGSGKTYTVQGSPQDGGIIRRSVDVIFNSISDYQAKKYIFKPDKFNGFDVQSEIEALADRQKLDLIPSYERARRFRRKEVNSTQSDEGIPDTSKVYSVDEDNVYSIFVTYIEMYGNYTYDLLEDFAQNNMTRELQSKILRNDSKNNMFVHGCTELEVKTPQDAIEVFRKGQNRRKVAQTKMNWESSRSHSVFTIRAVQAPLDERGEEVVTDKKALTISQLSIVDLAGSERTSRTGATGERLKESGTINNSLMCLRQCIEILRCNQQFPGSNKTVPYRASKITHYFKNYFEGEGKVKMVICLNPLADLYDETSPVMQFAELASEIQIYRPVSSRNDFGLTPGRRKANIIFKEARRRLSEEGHVTEQMGVELEPIFSICPKLSSTSFSLENMDEVVSRVKVVLKQRIAARDKRELSFHTHKSNLKRKIEDMEKENLHLKSKADSFHSLYENELKKTRYYEAQLRSAHSKNESLFEKFNDYNSLLDDYKLACEERDMAKSQGHLDKQRIKTRAKLKIEQDRDRMKKELHRKLADQGEHLKSQLYEKQVKALNEFIGKRGPSDETPRTILGNAKSNLDISAPNCVAMRTRHRRSRSQGAVAPWADVQNFF